MLHKIIVKTKFIKAAEERLFYTKAAEIIEAEVGI
jgi:hypothetical protein